MQPLVVNTPLRAGAPYCRIFLGWGMTFPRPSKEKGLPVPPTRVHASQKSAPMLMDYRCPLEATAQVNYREIYRDPMTQAQARLADLKLCILVA